ncbi:MAG: DivIVA domain-containing protein [Bacilli bacterium]|nr:DivIVA domain-containing protein [Bacilli bacterium]
MDKFDRKLLGYDINQVNQFVDDTIIKVDMMINKMKSKDLEIEKLKDELEYYKNNENKINQTINIEEPKVIKESDKIINKAKDNANKIINDALEKAEELENESQRLRRNILIYKTNMQDILEEQYKLIDDLDKVELNDTNK